VTLFWNAGPASSSLRASGQQVRHVVAPWRGRRAGYAFTCGSVELAAQQLAVDAGTGQSHDQSCWSRVAPSPGEQVPRSASTSRSRRSARSSQRELRADEQRRREPRTEPAADPQRSIGRERQNE
jgi:hypothetical protein